MVADCTDASQNEKQQQVLTWRERKDRYIAHLARAPDRSVLVTACDKRQNLGALVGDVRAFGIGYLRRFNSKPSQQLWYYSAILKAIGHRLPPRLRSEMEIALADFKRLLRR